MPPLIAAALAGLALMMIGSLGWWAGIPLLLPSLGPTLAIQIGHPHLSSARVRNVAVGHTIGLAAGLLAVYLVGVASEPTGTPADPQSMHRVAAAVIAVVVSLAVQYGLGFLHPPAEATTLLVALGGVAPTLSGATTVLIAIALVTILGECARRLSIVSKASADAFP